LSISNHRTNLIPSRRANFLSLRSIIVGQASPLFRGACVCSEHTPPNTGGASYNKTGYYPELAGLEFQKKLEAAAFAAGGSDYSLPAQRLVDFLEGASPSAIPDERSCTRAVAAQLRGLLPEFVEHTLRSAVPKMLRSMRGVVMDEALLYASETRSSSPVRVVRGEDGQSAIRGLWPCGEGAGYAGGIVSSGIDGLRIAEAVVERMK
jgi:hypothetical protein